MAHLGRKLIRPAGSALSDHLHRRACALELFSVAFDHAYAAQRPQDTTLIMHLDIVDAAKALVAQEMSAFIVLTQISATLNISSWRIRTARQRTALRVEHR